ncbi:MAG: M20/M25/M40 family metallo-hydrolase [Aquaticitalea sp.]
MNKFKTALFAILFIATITHAQDNQTVIDNMVKEATENSQLEPLAHHLLDVIGPRLTGTPQLKEANDWIVAKYKEWGISAKNEAWGEWKAWERGITHIDMISPRVQTLDGMQLAWSPGTGPKGVTAEAVILPTFNSEEDFTAWLKTIKGKFVMISPNQVTGRPDDNWKEYATDESFEAMKKLRDTMDSRFKENLKKTGYSNWRGTSFNEEGIKLIESAGAAGIIASYWSKEIGSNKIFGASTTKIPTVDIELEDYTMLYRMVEYGDKPKLKIVSESKDLGTTPVFNTIAEIKGTEKPEEYIILSAHLDSWDGATGATDNGTGTIVMMEAMRLLKKLYPNPKRTIIAGHWGSEEQGLNGSRAYVEDHPEIVANIQAVFNQDNGTGRVVNLSGAGFLHSYEYLTRWLEAVPNDISKHIETAFPGSPSGGGSDNASFVAAGAPAFNLSSLSWDYGTYTWHTNRDTYDKIVFDDVRGNAILAAILTYMASEDEAKTSNEKSVLPNSKRTGKQQEWPTAKSPTRKGGMD